MAKFPDYSEINYSSTVVGGANFKTLITNFDDLGRERRKRKWLYPKRIVRLSYDHKSKTDAMAIYQFFLERAGSYEVFTFFDHTIDTYENEYIGTGDGSTLIYNLPCRGSSSRTIYVNGAEQTITTDYTYSALGGTDGCDEITFEVASVPTDGHRITMDFTGNLKIRCRFKEDEFTFETFLNQFKTFGIELQGLLNDQ